MSSFAARLAAAARDAAGTAVILSANPIHDTGGGQRSAQIALELLERGWCVLFVSRGRVTETVDLELEYAQERLVRADLRDVLRSAGRAALEDLLARSPAIVLTQVPVRSWSGVLERAGRAGAVTVYDCIDYWDSELGRGWYRRGTEADVACASDLLLASAPDLAHHVELLAEQEAHLLPNAFNSRVFDPGVSYPRPADLPEAEHVALYVGALWGGWMDWDVVRRAAGAHPDTRFVFVGDHRGEGKGLPGNCHFPGLKPQAALPAYLAHADVAFLPWRRNRVTGSTSPLKVYEFVAMGLPVVAPDLEPLRGIPGVERTADPERFPEALAVVGRAGLATSVREEMEAFSRRNSWVERVDALLALANAVRDRPGRPSAGDATGSPDRAAGEARHAHGRTAGEATRGTRGRASSRRPGGSDAHTPVVAGGSSIAVVMPAYDHERYVGTAVDSVRTQSLPAGELVVVDDGSTDGTPDVLAERAHDRMRVIRQENRGAHAAINRGIALSSGDWIALLNSDDAFTPERLEHAWGVVRTTGAALLTGAVRLVDEDGRPLDREHPTARWYGEARSEPERTRTLRRALLRHNFAVTTSNFFFHRELWRRLGGFRAFRYVHDYDFLLRALELCPSRVRYEPSLEDVLYRVHGSNTITEDVERALSERADLLRGLRRPIARLARARTRRRDARAVRRAVEESESLTPVATTKPSGAATSASGVSVDQPDGAATHALHRGAERPRPIELGMVVTSLDRGGLEQVVALLARSLPSYGIRPHVLCTHAGGILADTLRSAEVAVTVAGGRVAEWRRWMEDARPAVVSSHFADVDVVEALHGWDLPIVETVHNTYAWFGADDWAREVRKASRLTATVAVSRTVGRYYARRCTAAPRPQVIPNAVQPARAAVVPRAFARGALALEEGVPVLVHPGRMSVQKNLSGLIDAFSDVLDAAPTATLLLAGPAQGGHLRGLKRRYARLARTGSVRFLPPVPHVGTLLSAADAFVSNSFYEGWSVAASEALWAGLPLVLSDCGGSRELVGEDGRRGRVVPNPLGDSMAASADTVAAPPPAAVERNRRALSGALLSVIDERATWAERGPEIRAHARNALAPRRMAEAYARLLRRVANGA